MKNKTLNTLALLCLTLFSISTIAQDTNTEKYTAHNKGKFYVSWGGNRETFSKSDIRFEGEGYDFTIQDATAKDKPKGWHIDTLIYCNFFCYFRFYEDIVTRKPCN